MVSESIKHTEDSQEGGVVGAAELLIATREELGGGRERDFDTERNQAALSAVLGSNRFELRDIYGAITRLSVQGRVSPDIAATLQADPRLKEINDHILYGDIESWGVPK